MLCSFYCYLDAAMNCCCVFLLYQVLLSMQQKQLVMVSQQYKFKSLLISHILMNSLRFCKFCQYTMNNLNYHFNYELLKQQMKTGLLTSSSFFGKYVPNQGITHLLNQNVHAINLKQNYTHQRPFVSCKFDIPGNRLYLLDTSGTLIHLNLNDNSFSTLKSEKIQNFTVDGNNSLNILYVTQKSELFRVSFENKKPSKITNLNMNRIIAFQRNYLRDMLLSLDYKLLFLCDVNKAGPLKIKSLKAKNDQIFTNACFSSNNRFIILAVKNIQIRIVEIMNLKSVHEIKLPFAVNNLKIQVSYDSRRVAIYGDCHIIFFINILENETYSYQLMEIPFVKSIALLKYTSENDLVFLGSDQILYAVSPNQLDKAVPIFNQQFQIRTMSFDVSLDCSKIAIVSNRTVLQLKFQKGLRKQIEQKSQFKQMEYRKNGFQTSKPYDQPILQVSQEQIQDQAERRIQYEDEDDEQQDGQKDNQNQNKEELKEEIQVGELYKSKEIPSYKQQCGSLNSIAADLKGVSSQIKVQISSVLNNLVANHKQVTRSRTLSITNSLIKLIRDYKLNPEKCYRVMDFVIRSVNREIQKIRHYGLILCPQIVAIIERKCNKNFGDFCEDELLALYSNYFYGREWKDCLNWLLSAGVNEKSQNMPLLLICALQHILEKIQERGGDEYHLFLNPGQLQISFSQIYNRLVKIYLDDRYKNLFLKRKVVEMVGQVRETGVFNERISDNRLQQLILKQDEIKKALSDLKRTKGPK